MKDQELFNQLAVLFDYPGPDYYDQLQLAEQLYDQAHDFPVLDWIDFCRAVKAISLESLQEVFISSFDLKAGTSLDLGHLLFGEDTKRNGFLIHLKEEHEKVHHDCGKEMADYLPNMLHLIALSEDADFVEELCVSLIQPALKLMQSGLLSDENPYSHLLNVLVEILSNRYTESACLPYIPVTKPSCNYSKSHCHHG